MQMNWADLLTISYNLKNKNFAKFRSICKEKKGESKARIAHLLFMTHIVKMEKNNRRECGTTMEALSFHMNPNVPKN